MAAKKLLFDELLFRWNRRCCGFAAVGAAVQQYWGGLPPWILIKTMRKADRLPAILTQ